MTEPDLGQGFMTPDSRDPAVLLAFILRLQAHMNVIFARIRGMDASEEALRNRLQAQFSAFEASMEETFRDHVIDSLRYRVIREHTVRVAGLKVNGSKRLLDHQVDEVMRQQRKRGRERGRAFRPH